MSNLGKPLQGFVSNFCPASLHLSSKVARPRLLKRLNVISTVEQNDESEPRPERDPEKLMIYQIKLKGHLSPQWANWLDGWTATLEQDRSAGRSGCTT